MSDISANLALPYLAPSQAQKHVTHNEALQILDAVVQLAVVARDQSDPPAQPDTGVRHIVPLAATGAWAGQEDCVALWSGNAWIFITPQTGWRAWVAAERIELAWHDGQWQPLNDLDNVTEMGINAVADTTNRLSVSAPATLFNHEGAGHRLKINKADASDTASLLFQTGFSGRAEMGLTGSDAWSIKLSDDGAGWTEALTLDPASGLARGTAVQSSPDDATPGRLQTTDSLTWGYSADYPPPGNDLDNHVTPGVCDIDASTLNKPPTSSSYAGTCLTLGRNSGRLSQMAFEIRGQNETYIWVRTLNGEGWGAWVPLVPERGSNANGEYVRFADGTQLCWHRAGTDTAQDSSWTFPAQFSSKPDYATAQVITDSLKIGQVRSTGLSSTGFYYNALNINDIRFAHQCSLFASGRWF